MDLFQSVLITAALLCSLVAGFLFAYAVVVMPGIGKLGDAEFLRAFQVTDRVIQDNHPLFLIVWLGSAVAVISAASLGFMRLAGVELTLLVVATVVYILGVQFSTIRVHLPLNNRLQQLDLDTLDADALAAARAEFEPRWNASNRIRTILATLVSLTLLLLLARL
ncbi:MAG: anthrone oxygenase family protein [Pseudomonadota bacterium]